MCYIDNSSRVDMMWNLRSLDPIPLKSTFCYVMKT